METTDPLSAVHRYDRWRTITWKVERLVHICMEATDLLKMRDCLLSVAMTVEKSVTCKVERLVMSAWRKLIHSWWDTVDYLQLWQAKNYYPEGGYTVVETADLLQERNCLLSITMTGEGPVTWKVERLVICVWRWMIHSRWDTVYYLLSTLQQVKDLLLIWKVLRLVLSAWRLLIHSRWDIVHYLQLRQAKNCYPEGGDTVVEIAELLQEKHSLLSTAMTV